MQNANKFEVPYIMAPEAGKDITGTGAIEYVTAANSTMHDYKWNVPADGDYRITLDFNRRTIVCERVDLSAQYAKMLEGKRLAANDMKLYLVGDATPCGWNISGGGQPDRKWYITKAGYYQIKVDVVNRKVYFKETTGK